MGDLIVREIDEIGNAKDRPMTADEIKKWEQANKIAADEKAFFEKKENNRKSALAKLAALGLTEDEIAAL